MSVLFDYFVAPSDAEAAATLDRMGGPGASQGGAKGAKRRLFRRSEGVQDSAYPVVADTGIDPVVQVGTLEALLTERPYEEVISHPRQSEVIDDRDGGERLVVAITDTLVAALAEASEEQLIEVAIPWSETEEFWGGGDPAELAQLLKDLAVLARVARAEQQFLYCWVCV